MSDHLAYVPGHVVRVRGPRTLDVSLRLPFGISVEKTLNVIGIDVDIPAHQAVAAEHCLVVLTGGKNIVAHLDPRVATNMVSAAVFVESSGPDEWRVEAVQADPLIYVSSAMRWAAQHNFDAGALRRKLKGV